MGAVVIIALFTRDEKFDKSEWTTWFKHNQYHSFIIMSDYCFPDFTSENERNFVPIRSILVL